MQINKYLIGNILPLKNIILIESHLCKDNKFCVPERTEFEMDYLNLEEFDNSHIVFIKGNKRYIHIFHFDSINKYLHFDSLQTFLEEMCDPI
jgi:hypothetical protein